MLTPTKERGAQAKPMPGLYVDPAAHMTDQVASQFLAGSGLNGAFVADLMSGMLAHERCGTHLYRSCAARTLNPMLERRYKEFGKETEEHVAILEDLIGAAGGNPAYVSPTARAVQGMDTKLLESTFALSGSIDVMTTEMAMLDAVMLAESMDEANWRLLEGLCEQIPAGAIRERFRSAVTKVRGEETEHLTWALETKSRLVMMQAESGAMATIGAKAEELMARVRNWFS